MAQFDEVKEDLLDMPIGVVSIVLKENAHFRKNGEGVMTCLNDSGEAPLNYADRCIVGKFDPTDVYGDKFILETIPGVCATIDFHMLKTIRHHGDLPGDDLPELDDTRPFGGGPGPHLELL
ncbi:MAG: hypothetical protein ABIH34_08370 [Nanoarchaeota archaeon]